MHNRGEIFLDLSRCETRTDEDRRYLPLRADVTMRANQLAHLTRLRSIDAFFASCFLSRGKRSRHKSLTADNGPANIDVYVIINREPPHSSGEGEGEMERAGNLPRQ